MNALRPLLDPEFKKTLLLRLPWDERMTLFERYARLTKDARRWSLLHPFDELTGDEMRSAIAAIERADRDGLGALDRGQRTLVLRAGATAFFRRLLSVERSK